MLTKQQEKALEIETLINMAWLEYDLALKKGDEKTANFFMNEAIELLNMLPANEIKIRIE